MKYPGSVFFFLVCLLGLAVVYSFLPISQAFEAQTRGVSLKFDTPDEMINYAFTLNYQKTNRLYYVEYVNDYFPHPIVFPRWARTDGAFVYPGTFLGMIILAGTVAKIVGTIAIPFMTPFIAVILVLIFYSLVKRFFDKQVAFIGAITLALFPLFLYYASRIMFHTILFLFFILLGVWLYLKAFEDNQTMEIQNSPPKVDQPLSDKFQVPNKFQIQNSKLQTLKEYFLSIFNFLRVTRYALRVTSLYYLSALSFGLALFIRFADIWLVLLTILALMLYKRMDPKRIAVFFCVFVVSVIPLFLLNHVLYGNWLDFGYPTIVTETRGSGVSGFLGYVLPFGFHPRVMWNVFINVLVKPYWFYWFIATLGYWLLVKDYWKSHRKDVVVFTVYCLLFTVYLISFYGSWKFSDSIDPTVVAISSSYYRYFLPLFMLAVPFVGFFIVKIISMISSKPLRVALYAFVPLYLFAFVFAQAYLGEEGLLHVRRQVMWYRQQVKILKERGASYNDLFLVRRGQDKVLFPEFPKIVNVDYLDPKLVEESLKKYKGTVWESKNGAFYKRTSASVGNSKEQ